MKSLLVIFCLLFGVFAQSTFVEGATVSTRPILFVHGFNPFGLGENCKSIWGKMESSLTAQGFTGLKLTLGYYFDDSHCDAMTTPKGTILTTIPSLSKDLAWYIYNNFSQSGISVDVVAHSMGGLMIRYALYRIAAGDSAYPPFINVTHVTTLGSPFTGYSLIAEACHVNVMNMQCDEMAPYSSFVSDLASPMAILPQAQGGTLWNNVGSNADILDSSDGFVPSASATSMSIPSTSKVIMPWYRLVFHTLYTRNSRVIQIVAKSLGVVSADQVADLDSLPETEIPEVPESEDADVRLSRNDVFEDFSQLNSNQRPGQIESYLENNVPSGAKFTKIDPQGLFAKMGIQENDIVQGCTPETLNNPFVGLSSLEKEDSHGKFKFCILRQGARLTKVIKI